MHRVLVAARVNAPSIYSSGDKDMSTTKPSSICAQNVISHRQAFVNQTNFSMNRLDVIFVPVFGPECGAMTKCSQRADLL